MTRTATFLLVLTALPWTAFATTLTGTTLYTKTTYNCRALDLATWRHPTREILKKAGIGIDAVELCNNDKFPIFTISPKYDPQTATEDYYHKLYARLAEANGWWSYALVDTIDKVIVGITVDKKMGSIDVSYEDFN